MDRHCQLTMVDGAYALDAFAADLAACSGYAGSTAELALAVQLRDVGLLAPPTRSGASPAAPVDDTDGEPVDVSTPRRALGVAERPADNAGTQAARSAPADDTTPADDPHWRLHPLVGHGCLSRSNRPFFALAADIALHHHEAWDGSGFPFQLRGDAIPLPARIAAVVDVLQGAARGSTALSPADLDAARQRLVQASGRALQPALVRHALRLIALHLAPHTMHPRLRRDLAVPAAARRPAVDTPAPTPAPWRRPGLRLAHAQPAPVPAPLKASATPSVFTSSAAAMPTASGPTIAAGAGLHGLPGHRRHASVRLVGGRRRTDPPGPPRPAT